MHEELGKLKKLVLKELDKIASKGDITPAELEVATKALCLLEKVKMVEEPDYSESYSRNASYRQMRNNAYDDGRAYNYNNYGGDNSHRDYYLADMGQRYHTMDRGYSGHSVRDRMISELESTMMDNAKSESERRVIESLISQLDSGNH